MALKTAVVSFTDTTTIKEVCSLTNGSIRFAGNNTPSGSPSFEFYSTPDGSGGSFPLTSIGLPSMSGVTGSVYAKCTDLSGNDVAVLNCFAWDAS